MNNSKHEILEKTAKGAIFYDTNRELGLVIRDWTKYVRKEITELGVMPKNIYGLSEQDIGIKRSIKVVEGTYEARDAETIFIPYNECTRRQQELIDSKSEKLDKFRKEVSQDKSQKYDKPGTITLHVYGQRLPVLETTVDEVREICSGKKSEQDYLIEEDTITIPITQRQLANLGLLPEDYKWQEDEKSKVSEIDIAEADKSLSLTESNIRIIDKFFDYIKSIFKGKGEK